MSGTVNISRRIWHDTAFKDEPFTEREAFIWIVMEASYKGREKRVGKFVVELSRGQLATSVRFMCVAWNWSKSKVDRFLKRLEKRDMIGTSSGTGINVITVCKYDEYQNTPKASGTAKTENRDSSGTAAGQQRDKPNKGLIPEAMPEAIKVKKEGTNVPLSVSPPAIDEVSKSVSAYNATASRTGWPIVQKLSPARRAALTARLKDAGGAEGWAVALAKAEASPFLTGQTGNPFRASFDFLTKQSNFTKLMEGNYDPRDSNEHSPSGRTGHGIGSGTADAFASVAAKMLKRQNAGG
jgi:hypothetical protein